MKKILAIVLALIVLIGCTPYHDTKVNIGLNSDLSGVINVTGSISKTNTEEPLENVQKVITDIVKEVEKYEGTLTSSIEDSKLTFEYEESFSNLEDLNTMIKRLFDEDVNITETVESSVFKNTRVIDGLKFDSDKFLLEIYDAIEKDELFGEDSDRVRSHQRTGSMMIVFDEMEYYSSETLEVTENKKIVNDALTVIVDSEESFTLINVITIDETMDVESLKTHYEDKFKNMPFEAELQIENNTDGLTITLSEVNQDEMEAYESEVFGRFVSLNMTNELQTAKNSDVFNLFFEDDGFTYSMMDHIEAYETFLDVSNYKIKEINGFDSVSESSVVINDGVIALGEGESVRLVVQENNPLKIVFTVLKYIGIALLVIAVAVAAFFGFKKVKKANEERLNDEVNTTSSNDESSQERNEVNDDSVELDDHKLIGFNKEHLPNFKQLVLHKNSISYAGIMFGVYVVLSMLIMVFVKAMINSGLSSLTSLPFTPSDQISSFVLLRVAMNFVGSGSVKFSMAADGGMFGGISESATFSAYMFLFIVIIATATYFIHKKMFKDEHENSFEYALVGSVMFAGVVALLAIIPVNVFGGFGLGLSVSGSILRVILYTLPLVIIVTHVLYTYKTKLNSKAIQISTIVYEGLVRSAVVIAIVSVVSVLFVLIYQKEMLILISNVIGFASGIASGISLAGNFGYRSAIGIFNFTEVLPILYLFYVIFIVIISIDLNFKFKESKIKDEIKFSIIYTLSVYLPIVIIGLVSTASMAAEGERAGMNLDFLTLIVAPIITAALMFVRLKYLSTFGFELFKRPMKETTDEDSKQENAVEVDKAQEEVMESEDSEAKMVEESTEENTKESVEEQ